MFKKILVLTFFWIIFVLFFALLFIMPVPDGTTLQIDNHCISLVLQFIGMFVFSSLFAGYIYFSIQYLKDIK